MIRRLAPTRVFWLLLGFALGCLDGRLRSQDDVLQGTYGAAGTGAPMAMPLSSIRAAAPTAPDSPGYEGQLAVDERYLYSFHRGVWRRSARANLD